MSKAFSPLSFFSQKSCNQSRWLLVVIGTTRNGTDSSTKSLLPGQRGNSSAGDSLMWIYQRRDPGTIFTDSQPHNSSLPICCLGNLSFLPGSGTFIVLGCSSKARLADFQLQAHSVRQPFLYPISLLHIPQKVRECKTCIQGKVLFSSCPAVWSFLPCLVLHQVLRHGLSPGLKAPECLVW